MKRGIKSVAFLKRHINSGLNIGVLKRRVFKRIVQTHGNSRIYLRDENYVIYTSRGASFLLRIKY